MMVAQMSSGIGTPSARRWWTRLWPAEHLTDYAGAAGFHAARIARLVTFVMLFLPLAGPAGFLVTLAELPLKLVRWQRSRPAAALPQAD